MKGVERMNNKDQLLDDQFHFGINNFGVQLAAPFYALSEFFMNSVNLQTDVVRFMNQESKNKFTLETSKISSRAYSILQQKARAKEIEEYITKLVEEDLAKKETTENLIEPLREEFLSEINKLKQEWTSQVIGIESNQANDLRDSVTKLDEKKLDKEELQTLLSTLRREYLEQIDLLKKELAIRPAVPVTLNDSNPAKIQTETVKDMKEGQLLENDRVIGTIEEVIDVDF